MPSQTRTASKRRVTCSLRRSSTHRTVGSLTGARPKDIRGAWKARRPSYDTKSSYFATAKQRTVPVRFSS